MLFLISEFQAHWQRTWRDSEEYRRLRIPYEDFQRRHIYLRCYRDLFLDRNVDRKLLGKAYAFPESQYKMIASNYPARGLCPTWPLAKRNLDVDDESEWRDNALRPSLRASVSSKRDSLVRMLEVAYSANPRNGWTAGQLIRFSLDAKDFSTARRALAGCQAVAWWCSALTGLVLARAGETAEADSAYARMRRAMSDSVRCDWEDVSQLLERESQSEYRKLGCAARDSLHNAFWWLSDPLYRDAGNARLVEQESRRVEIALRSAISQDERFTFLDEEGGDAVKAVLTRYGRPSYTAWSGVAGDRNESFQGLAINYSAAPSPPYTTLEYNLGRTSTVPTWRAVSSPFSSTASDWRLAETDSIGAPTASRWPAEFFLPKHFLVQLPPGQTVTIRRHSYVEVVSSVELSHPAQMARPAIFDVLLLSTSAASRVDSIDQQTSQSGKSVRLRGRISANPQILAIEATGLSLSTIDARTRFAFAPPSPLEKLAASEIAISDIAVLSSLSAERLESPTDSLLAFLHPRLSFSGDERLMTLYWESYGTHFGDSANIVLRVVPDGDASLLSKIGAVAGLISDPTRGIEIRWRDQEARNRTSTLIGPVPTQARSVNLNLRSLKPGRYAIEIGMVLRDGRSAVRRTQVELRP